MFSDSMEEENTQLSHYIFALVWLLASSSNETNTALVTALWMEGMSRDQALKTKHAVDTLVNHFEDYSATLPDCLLSRWFVARQRHDMDNIGKAVKEAVRQHRGLELISPFYNADNLAWMEENFPASKSVVMMSASEYKEVDVAHSDQFNEEALFIGHLTSVAEELRLCKSIQDRKSSLPGLVAQVKENLVDGVYIPLLNTDKETLNVVNVITEEAKVFSTRARAPTLLVFEVLRVSQKAPMEEDDLRPCSTFRRQSSFHLQWNRCTKVHLRDYLQFENDHGSPNESMESSEAEESDVISVDAQFFAERVSSRGEENTKNVQHETWADKKARIKRNSPYGCIDGWNLKSIIAKSFDDMRQEVFALQLIAILKAMLHSSGLDQMYLRVYEIVCTGPSVGLIETLSDTYSIDSIKKSSSPSLYEHFKKEFGQENEAAFEQARSNFIRSAAAYSLVSYLFQIKDRHNGNIMLDNAGHIIHIDFGPILGIAPGGSFSLETAPFKLTKEMVEIMGGPCSEGYAEFKRLFTEGLLIAQENATRILAFVKVSAEDSPFPCFKNRSTARILRHLRKRLCMDQSADEARAIAIKLIDSSLSSLGTSTYDQFQRKSNGIAY